jgi:hypothetical protein
MESPWRLLAMTFLAFPLVCGAARAQSAPVEVRVTAMDPESPALLHSGNSLSVRVAYKSDQVLRVQAGGYRAGCKIPGGMNGSPGYGPGEGEAIAWIFFSGAETIDEVRVVAHDAHWKPLTEVSVKVDARWSPDAPQHERAAWVRELNDAQQRGISADMRRTQEGPLAAVGLALVQILFLAVPSYLLLQVLSLWRWRGGWRRRGAAAADDSGDALLPFRAGEGLQPLAALDDLSQPGRVRVSRDLVAAPPEICRPPVRIAVRPLHLAAERWTGLAGSSVPRQVSRPRA